MDRTLIWQLAIRYLRGKRSANAVPILSRISMVAIAVSSAAMIVAFSVFNGLEAVVKNMYVAFYPDIKITAAKGKFFSMDNSRLNAIKQVNGVQHISTVIEDHVFANNHEQQKVITLKGIKNDYFNVNEIKKYIIQGDDTVSADPVFTAIAGHRIMNELGLDVNTLSYIMLYYPNPTVVDPSANPMSALQSLKLHPAGVFRIQEDFDNTYILAPLQLVQDLFHQPGHFSSVEISAKPGAVPAIKKQLQGLLGNGYKVENRFEQNKTLYMVMGSEKWAIYAILVLVLLIASFNMVGALSMLVLEKQKDIAILKAMGALPATIRKIFLLEGILWSLVGGLSGIILGGIICFIQLTFGILRMGSAFVVDAYPVKMLLTDFALVLVTILTVGLLASWYPSIRATKAIDPTLKSA
jgi:lipoprotein-releasing system permease protein